MTVAAIAPARTNGVQVIKIETTCSFVLQCEESLISESSEVETVNSGSASSGGTDSAEAGNNSADSTMNTVNKSDKIDKSFKVIPPFSDSATRDRRGFSV